VRRERANRFASWEDLSPHGSCFYCIPIRAGPTGQVVIVFAEQANTRDEVTNSRTCTRMVVPPTIGLGRWLHTHSKWEDVHLFLCVPSVHMHGAVGILDTVTASW
jgi:hypothetical protein